MTLYAHDITRALDAHEGLRTAYTKRLPEAREALIYWRNSTAPDFKALRRSLGEDLRAALGVVAHLTKNTSDVVVLGIGGSSLGAQTLAQLAYWGTPAYAPREGTPRLHIVDNLDGATFATLLKNLDLKTTRFHVVSKSGTTAEPLMQLMAAIGALEPCTDVARFPKGRRIH